MNFKITVDDAEVYRINKFLNVSNFIDIYVDKTSVTIEYELNLNLKEWGIKSIDCFIKKITSNIDWEVDCEELTDSDKEALIKSGGKEYSNNTISGSISIDSTNTDWKIENDVTFHPDGTFLINYVYIELGECIKLS
jgi:hypothetical protein